MKKILFYIFIFSSTIFSTPIDSLLISGDTNIYVKNMNIGKGVGVSTGRYIFSLVILSLLIVGLYLFLRYLKKRGEIGLKNKNIEVLESFGLDSNSKLFIVRVSNNLFLLGGSGASLNLIYKFTEKESIELLSSYDEGLIGNHIGEFAGKLNDFMQKYRKKDE